MEEEEARPVGAETVAAIELLDAGLGGGEEGLVLGRLLGGLAGRVAARRGSAQGQMLTRRFVFYGVLGIAAFLMGIVLAYQSADQLAKFGATIFVVDLVGNSVLRELAVLLTAIMVAGRSGSAFAAALGTMKLNEEIDALQVMGLNPNQILVAPRVIGLTLAMPFLAMFANIAGLAGAAFICLAVLDIHWVQFHERVASAVATKELWIGLVKAPFFALLIAATGVLRGMQVTGSAEELGRLTTMAVVQSIFLIIVADAFFAILFSRIGV